MINMYYGRLYSEEFTLEEIGEKYGLTKERVRQVIQKAFRKIRSEAILENNYFITGKN
jgi:RNA polymerase primary sigma factor